jgi:hypothetical protein
MNRETGTPVASCSRLFVVGGAWVNGRPAASQPLLEHVPGERADGER